MNETPASAAAPVQDAFRLGWTLVELRSRILIADLKSRARIAPTTPLESSVHLSSVWRAGFNRLSTLLEKALPDANAEGTLYEPPAREQLPYLYPPAPDYANVGIAEPPETKPVLASFHLYEVTRRAINCLTMLYVDERDALIPDMVQRDRDRLVVAILKAAQNPAGGGGDETEIGGAVSAADTLQRARQALTERIEKFLGAWDGYIRENYYNGGVIKNDDMELIAYEAGYSMSSVSWNISVAAARDLAEAARAAEATRTSTAAPGGGATLASGASAPPLRPVWAEVFSAPAVARLQHQVTALSTVLDAAYHARPKNEAATPASPPPTSHDPAATKMADFELPSQALQAVRHSLDFWQRAVEWFVDESPSGGRRRVTSADLNEELRVALVEQANIWQSLVIGQQTLRGFTVETVTRKIFQDVTAQIETQMRSNLLGSVRQAPRVLVEVSNDAVNAVASAGHAAVNAVEHVFATSKLWLIAAACAFGLLFFAAALFATSDDRILDGIGTIGSIFAGFFGVRNLQKTKDNQRQQIDAAQTQAKQSVGKQTTTLADRIGTAGQGFFSRAENTAQSVAAEMLEALERGYRQVRIELAGLSRVVSVSYPLLELFVWKVPRAEAFPDDDNDHGVTAFIKHVLWTSTDRNEEIQRITVAALGPLSMFLGDGGEALPAQRGTIV